MADQWQQWADNITAANGTNSGNIYRNYARAKSGIEAAPEASVAPKAVVQAKIDDINKSNADAAAKLEAQRQQDATNPNKAQMVLLPNNQGYAFYDGTGKQININQFSLLTGKRPDEILGDSPVAKDQKFVQDYKTLMALSNAWVNGDTQTLDKLRAADPNKFNSLISSYKTPADMVNAFTKHWSDYYGTNNQQDNTNSSFGPQQINTPDKQQSQQLATGSLGQVLTPQPTGPPNESFWDKLNPWSGAHKATNNYNKVIQSNPWFAYHNSLYGN